MGGSFLFYNGLLPLIGSKSEYGRLSGLGWGSGYIGAVVALLLVLFILILPDPPFWTEQWLWAIRATYHAVCRFMANYICAALIYIRTKACCPAADWKFYNTNDHEVLDELDAFRV